MATVVYYLSVCPLIVHEMDAVMFAEWRLLFGLRNLPDESAYPTFLLLHVPVFFVVLWLSQHRNQAVSQACRCVVSVFLIAHAGIHFYVSSAPGYGFTSMLSQSLIIGSAVLAGLYLALKLSNRAQNPRRDSC